MAADRLRERQICLGEAFGFWPGCRANRKQEAAEKITSVCEIAGSTRVHPEHFAPEPNRGGPFGSQVHRQAAPSIPWRNNLLARSRWGAVRKATRAASSLGDRHQRDTKANPGTRYLLVLLLHSRPLSLGSGPGTELRISVRTRAFAVGFAMVTILTHFTFESPIRKLCLRCCQSQLGIHFRTPLSGTWISQGKITAFLVAVLRSAFLHRESGDDSRLVFVKGLASLPSASCPPHDALHPATTAPIPCRL